MNNIGQAVVINPDDTRFLKSVYSKDNQSGYILLKGRRVKVTREGWVDARQLCQTWKIINV